MLNEINSDSNYAFAFKVSEIINDCSSHTQAEILIPCIWREFDIASWGEQPGTLAVANLKGQNFTMMLVEAIQIHHWSVTPFNDLDFIR